MTRPIVVALALVATAACQATVGERGVSGIPGEEVWKTEVELQLGEVAYVDGQELELRLDAVGVNDATITIRGDGPPRQERLTVGLAGAVEVPPYEIRLLSTGVDASARIEVRREVGS